MAISIPVMLTAKYGADAVYTGKMKSGFTLGLGMRRTSFTVQETELPVLFQPIAMAEYNVIVNKVPVKFRYLGSIAKSPTDSYALQYSIHSAHLIFTPFW